MDDADRSPLVLDGTWRAAPADDALRRTFPDYDLDDSGWEQVEVPGHWHASPGLADAGGPVLHRKLFERTYTGDGDRHWLVLDGVLAQGDVWLDGAYLGDTETWFAPHTFEITDAVRRRREHCLGVEVSCPEPGGRRRQRTLTGSLQHGGALDPAVNPGGIWRPVRVERTGPVRIARLRATCTHADPTRAVLSLEATLDAALPDVVRLRTTVSTVDHEQDRALAAGSNVVRWSVTVPSPRLWWPWALGERHLHDLGVEVRSHDGSLSHRRVVRTGLRSVDLRRWVLQVNGEPLFAKGVALGPTRQLPATAPAAEVAGDLDLARSAGFDLVRVRAHVARPELYERADELGVLVWQDLPLQWGHHRSVRRRAAHLARAAVDVLGHHPSVALWCGRDAPLEVPAQGVGDPVRARRGAVAAVARHLLPDLDRVLVDSTVARALRRADPSRPVVPHSGVLPHPPISGGTDTPLPLGWVAGREDHLPRLAALAPRLVRFVSGFGAPSLPDDLGFLEPERWPDLDWERLVSHHGLDEVLLARVPPSGHASAEAWRDATQRRQAELVRRMVGELRRLKYRPTGGFVLPLLVDAHPAVSWSLVGHDRTPKAAYRAAQEACLPVTVVVDQLPAVVPAGSAHALDVHVVSDLRHPLPGATVTATVRWVGGGHRWRWRGDVPADACARVTTLPLVVPGDLPTGAPGAGTAGEVEVEVELAHAGTRASDRTRARVAGALG